MFRSSDGNIDVDARESNNTRPPTAISPRVWSSKSRDAVQQRRLSRARRAEQNRDAIRRKLKRDVQLETAGVSLDNALRSGHRDLQAVSTL